MINAEVVTQEDFKQIMNTSPDVVIFKGDVNQIMRSYEGARWDLSFSVHHFYGVGPMAVVGQAFVNHLSNSYSEIPSDKIKEFLQQYKYLEPNNQNTFRVLKEGTVDFYARRRKYFTLMIHW